MLIDAKDKDGEIHRRVKFHPQLLLWGSPAHKSEGLAGSTVWRVRILLLSQFKSHPSHYLLNLWYEMEEDPNS